jgi:putative membrane protein
MSFPRISKENLILALKGFCMGTADIVPGVSGGTVALIVGIYDELISTLSSIDHRFFKTLSTFNLKNILEAMNFKFLFPLGVGILSALVIMARVMHYLMNNYEVYTWSLFFGLIIASILFLGKKIENIKSKSSIASITLGAAIGFLAVSLIPVTTPQTLPFIFGAGMIGICAMILPGISGSFILLILGKYTYVTSALKNPFIENNIMVILSFSFGCLVGLLSFSKVLNYFLQKHYNITMCVLTGFMIGSLKKIWPWKEILEQKIVRGKVHVIRDTNIFPNELNSHVIFALMIMITGFILVQVIERVNRSK